MSTYILQLVWNTFSFDLMPDKTKKTKHFYLTIRTDSYIVISPRAIRHAFKGLMFM